MTDMSDRVRIVRKMAATHSRLNQSGISILHTEIWTVYTYHCGMQTKMYSYSFQWMQWIPWTVAYWAWRSWIGHPRKCGLSRVWFVTSKMNDGEREIYLVTYLNICLCQFQVCRNLCRCIHQLLMLHRNPGLEAWIQMTLTSYIVSHCYRSSPNVT